MARCINLLGDAPNPMLENELSNETQVTPQTPPTFLFSTTNDETVPVMNSVLFYEALLRSGIPAELHIFEQGHHGSGLAQENPATAHVAHPAAELAAPAWMDGVRRAVGKIDGWCPIQASGFPRERFLLAGVEAFFWLEWG